MKAWLLGILFWGFWLPAVQVAGQTGIASVKLKMEPDRLDRIFKGGENLKFSLDVTSAAGGLPAFTKAWRKVGRSDILATTDTLGLNAMTAIESGSYYCLITDTDHNVLHKSDTIRIEVIDTKVNAYGFTRLCLGDSVGYGVAVSDEYTYTYKWYHLPGTDPVGTDEFYIVDPVTDADAGLYYCEVTDETHGFVFLSDTLDVGVSGYPEVGISVNGVSNNADKSFTFCYGTEVTLTVSNRQSGQPEARFLWTGSALEGASGEPEVRVNLKHEAVYRAMITNNGCVREDSVSLWMVRPDVLLPESRYVIEGEDVTLQSSVDGNYTYSWTNGTQAGVSTDKAYTFTAAAGKTAVALEVKTGDGLQCVNSDTCYVTGLLKMNYVTSINDGFVVSRQPLTIVQEDTVLCARQPLTLEVAYTGYDGYTYEWMKIDAGTAVPVDTGCIFRMASVEKTEVAGVKYFCRAYDLEKGGYVYSDTVKVVVKYTPVAEITEPDEAVSQCGGYPVVLKGRDALEANSPLHRFLWEGPGILSGKDKPEMTARMGVNGFYTLKVGVEECWDSTAIHIPTIVRTVDIASQLILPQAADQQLFVADRPEGGILTWYPNGDAARAVKVGDGTGTTARIDIREGDTLVAVKMEKDGCNFFDTCIVMIRKFMPSADPKAPDDGFALSYPILRVTSTVPRVCIGRDITLSVYNLGYDNYKYDWRKVGSPDKTGLSDSISYTVFHAQANDYGQYYCVATDPENPSIEIYSDTLTLYVDEGPEAVILRDAYARLCYGDEIELSTSTPFDPTGKTPAEDVATELLWTGEGIVGGQGTQTIRVKVGNTARFTLRASHKEGCWSEDTVTFPVVKPQVKIYPSLTTLEKAADVTFRAETELSAFEWGQNGIAVSGGKEITMNFDTTGYVSVVAGDQGCFAHDTARVFVKVPLTFAGGDNDGFAQSRPELEIPGTLKQINACPDTLITFRITRPEEENFQYRWWRVKGSGDILIHEGASYTFNVGREDGGRYYCTASEPDGTPDGKGVLFSDTLVLNVGDGPIAQITPDPGSEICVEGEVTLNASASADGTEGPLTYHWSGEGITAENEGDAVVRVAPSADAVYMVRVSNGGCSDSALIEIKVNKPSIVLPSRIQLPAPNAAYRVDARVSEGASVVWSFRESETGQLLPGNGDRLSIARDGWVIAEVTDANGCSVTDSCWVMVRQPVAYRGGDDDGFSVLEVSTRLWIEPTVDTVYVCLNNHLSLKAVVSGLGRYTYSWHRAGDNTSDKLGKELGTEPNLEIDYMRQDQAGKYYCLVSDLEDIVGGKPRQYVSDTIQVVVNPGPVARIERVDGETSWGTCFGNSINLKGSLVNGADFPNVRYEWSGDNFTTTHSENIIKATPMNDGLYRLTVSDEGSGCQDTLHVKFNIYSPEVRIPESYQLAASGTVSIPAVVNGNGDFTWYRRTYPGSSVSSDNPAVLNITEDTRIIVRFEQDGCYGFDTTTVFVKYPYTFRGGDDDGFAASDMELKIGLEREKYEVCRGWDIVIPTNTAALGRVLNYKWYKVGDETRTVLGEEPTLVLRAKSMADSGRYYCIVADPSIKDNFKKTLSTDTATVIILNGPLAEISKPNDNELKGIFCRGSEVLVSAVATENKKVNSTDVYAYEWFGENIGLTARDYEINTRMGASGRYIVKASLGECYTYDTVDLRIYEPEIHVQPVIFLAEPGDVKIPVENPWGDVIKWRFYYSDSPGFAASLQDGDTLKYRITGDGMAVVERYNEQCVGYDTCHIFVKNMMTFAGKDDDGFATGGSGAYCKPILLTEVVCEGNVATLYVPMVGDDFYRYKWVKVGEESREFPSSPLCKFESVTKRDEGEYYCIITDVNNNKTLTTDRVTLRVKELPKSSVLADQLSVCYGDFVTLEADDSQLKPDITYSYLWSGKGVEDYTAPVTRARIEENGTYRLVVSDGDCYITDEVTVSVLRTRLEVETVHHIKKGDDLTLTATVNGSATEPVTWLVGNTYYRNVNPLELTSSSLTSSMTFTVSTTGKCTVERRGNIFVRENTAYAGGNDDGYVLPNNLPQILEQCDVLLGCDVDTAVLWVNVLESENLIYRWEKYYESGGWKSYDPPVGATHVSGVDSARLIFTALTLDDGGRYRCKIRNNYGYTYSREIRLVKGGKPDLSAYPIAGNPVCEKTEFNFITNADIPHGGTAQGTGLHWKWYYSKDNINFSQRLPEVDFDAPSFTVKPCKEADEGYYMVQAENFCGSAFDTTFQEIWEAPRFVQQPSDVYVCDQGSVEVVTEVEGGGTYRYSLWQVNTDAAGNYVSDKRRMMREQATPSYTFNMVEDFDDGYYQWRVYNQCDSARSKLFRLTVEQPIVPDFVLVDTTICAGVGNSFRMVASNNVTNPTPTLQYYWEKNGERLPGSGNSYRISNLEEADAGIYICWAKHSCPEKQIKQYTVRTKARPKITMPVELQDGGSYCEGARVEMKVDYTSDAGEVYCFWIRNNAQLADDGHFGGTRTWHLTIDNVAYGDRGTYYVNLRNDCGTTSSNQVYLNVKEKARFTRDLSNQAAHLCVGSNLTLSVSTSGEPPITYTWMKNGTKIEGAKSASLTLSNVTHAATAEYSCYIQNSCNLEGTTTKTKVEVITPLIYQIEGGGGYCAEDFREITLSGFEEGVVYTLKRRNSLNESSYTDLKIVSGDTVSTEKLTFGKWGTGYYHVAASARKGSSVCSADMNGEIYIYQKPTPRQFDFYVSDPMCEGERYGELTLAGTEGNYVDYELLNWIPRNGGMWVIRSAQAGTNEPLKWTKVGEGVYRIMAKNKESGCSIQIGKDDTITERPYPVVYDLFAQNGDTTACYGMESDVVLQLANSEKTCRYTLYKDGESTERTMSGNLISWDKVGGGMYTVHAVTNYGCARDMGQVEVVDLPQLERFILDGNRVFCQEETGGEHFITLQGSSANIRYDLYTLSSREPVGTKYGDEQRSHLSWKVSLDKDETYYVVAADTHDMCLQPMADSVYIEANKLQIGVIPDTLIIINSKAHLWVDITGAMGVPQVTWLPSDKYTPIEGSHDVMTVALEEGELYAVKVEDDYCSAEGMVQVSVKGQKLSVKMRASDCFTPLDTLYLCEGEEVSLCAFASGGGGTYTYHWTDDFYTDSIPAPHKSKITYRRNGNEDGFVALKVESVYENVPQEVVDTVWIRMRKMPLLLLENENLTCVVPGTDTSVILSGTEAGVQYELLWRPQANAAYTSRAQLTGDGQGASFPVTDYSDAADAGYYQVKATKTYTEVEGETQCSLTSPAFQIRRAPRLDSIRAAAVTEYCEGDYPDTIYVKASEADVAYRLLRGNRIAGQAPVLVEQQMGTGEPFGFTGNYGTGHYQVIAVLDRCVDTLKSAVDINSKPRPTIDRHRIGGLGNHCDTENPIAVTIPEPKFGVAYTVYRNDLADAIVQDYGAAEELKLILPPPVGAGNYYVVAFDQEVQCSDTVRGLVVTEAPQNVVLPQEEFKYCANEEGVNGGDIIAVQADPLIHYELHDGSGNKIGDFKHLQDDTICYDGFLTTVGASGSFSIYADAGGCSGDKGFFEVQRSVAPADMALLGDSLGCVGMPHTMGLATSAVGVTYTLYKEGTEEPLKTLNGGGALNFGAYLELGTYYITARNGAGCESRMSHRYHIRPLPEFYKIYVQGNVDSYCQGEEGVQFGITGTQEGVTYYLQQWSSVYEDYRDVQAVELEGIGSGPMLFGGRYKKGSYRIRTDYCGLTMLDTIELTERPLPLAVKPELEGKACIDSTMTILVKNAEAGTNYTLQYAGRATDLDVLPGNAEVKWNISAAEDGVYTVLAERAGCTRLLEAGITTAVAPGIGDLEGIVTNKCEGDKDTLWLEAWETDVTYSLHAGGDTVHYRGLADGSRMIFPHIPAGNTYYVTATRKNCSVERGAFEFPGIALPVLADNSMEVIDCQPDRISSIVLKDLKAGYSYTLEGMTSVYEVKSHAGDTLIRNVESGEYSLVAYDPLTTCTSLPQETTVRVGVPQDSVISRLEYCPDKNGVKIQISGQTYGVLYTLLDAATGAGIDSLASATVFNKTLPAGRYVFKSERVGLWGGCWTTDTFTVHRYPYPNPDLQVEQPATLCEAGANEIVIRNSEENVWYMLKNTETGNIIDTVYGNGGRIGFAGRKPAGTYMITMLYKGLCPANYFDDFAVTDVPPKAIASGCEYCQDTEVQETGCELYVAGLKPAAEYVLFDRSNHRPIDTVSGVNAGYYQAMPEGDYYVTGTYIESGCTDTVAEMSVHRLTQPRVFPIINANGGGDCATEVQVTLSGGYEGDSVKYYLYMDGFYQVEGPVTASGAGVTFKNYKTPGNYTVYAVKGEEGKCAAWMEGSVVLYDRPANARLKVNGYNCSGEASAAKVTISATGTERDWKYFLSHAGGVSKKQEGVPFTTLTWDEIEGQPLPSGKYILYAANACDSVIAMDTAWVYDAAAPRTVSLVPYKDGVVCGQEKYEFDLEGESERGVTYTLQVGSETFEAIGDGKAGLHLGSYSMEVALEEVAVLYATVDTSQCTYFADSLRLIKDNYTQDPYVVGRGVDMCVEPGATMTISLAQPRVPRLDYYLMVNGHAVDTIFGDKPTDDVTFKPQTEIGCYSVYATSKTRKCDMEYPGRCMSLAPEPRSIDTEWDGQLCEGESHGIVVKEPQVGVRYYLMRNGVVQRDSAYGEGERLVVAEVTEPGTYTVLARVSDACTVELDGAVEVVRNPKPELHLIKEYTYLEGGEGVDISVQRPASPGVYYQIAKREDYPNNVINYVQANEYGDDVDLGKTSDGRRIKFTAGTYVVWTSKIATDFKCVAVDSLVVKEVGVEKFRLEVIGGTPYMCEAGECRKLRLSGSEKGTYYELYRRAGERTEFVASAPGTGKFIDFDNQCDTGYYYVMASKDITDALTGETVKAEAQMGDEVHLYVTSKLERYLLLAEKDGYCYLGEDGLPASPGGSIILDGSQSDQVSYQLYCNGSPVPGKTLTGTSGGKLKWSGLLGRTCDKNNDAGNVYTVIATDGKCQAEMAGSVNIVAVNDPQIVSQPRTELSVCMGERLPMGIQAYGCLLQYEWRTSDRIVHTDEGDVFVEGKVVGNASSYVIDSVTMADMGVYKCTVSNYCKSVDIDSITLSVREVVRMEGQMPDRMVCGDMADSVKLVSMAVGENYFWYKAGAPDDTLATASVYTIRNVTEAQHAGEYVCCTWNSCGALFDTVRLEFNREPDVTGFTYHEDTLCVGSPYRLKLESRDTLYWYKNNVLIAGKNDDLLALDSITHADAGAYKVVARNTCKEKEFNLFKLNVDDTLRPTVFPEAAKHYCEGSLLQLELQFEPSPDPDAASRIYTTWSKRNLVDPNYNNSLSYAINTTIRDEGGFIEVNYWNKCNRDSKMHNIYIDKPIRLANFDRDSVVGICTGEGVTEVIIRDPEQNLPEYNEYRWFKREGTNTLPAGESDTLQIEKKVENTGVFYCIVSNTCGTVTSGDVSLHIDTLPTVLTQPKARNPYCENSTLVVKMKARGGDLKYNWFAIKKGAETAERVGYWENGDIESEAQCTMENLSYEFDSCRLWCMVENGCGFVMTDTVIIRVDRELDLRADRTVAYICPGDVARVAVSTTVPECTNWDYYVARTGETGKTLHTVRGMAVDTLRLDAVGTYRIFDVFSTQTQCLAEESEVQVAVEPHDLFYVSLGHGERTTVCRGEPVQLKVKVEGGEGPWRIDIRRRSDGNTAPEIGGVPVDIYTRDTVFELNVITDQTFYIASAVQFNDPEACPGIVQGEDVAFVIQQPYGTYIGNVTDTVFGQCEQIDLAAVLQPYPALPAGTFYIDGVPSTDNKLGGQAGRYEVKYKAETSAGCADSARIILRIDPLPAATLSLSDTTICSGGEVYLRLETKDERAINYSIRSVIYDGKGKTMGRPTSLNGSLSSGSVSYPLSYNQNINSEDSIRAYSVVFLTDNHNCTVRPDDGPLRLFCRKAPRFTVAGRHSIVTNGELDASVKDFVVPVANKEVSFKVSLLPPGFLPWDSYVEVAKTGGDTLRIDKTDITSAARSFSASAAGTYFFTVKDKFCPSLQTAVRTITYLDSAFIRTKVLLEGAYRKDQQKMVSALWPDKLPNENWGGKWPQLGERKGIDWVTLEIREEDVVRGKVVFSGQFLLLDDGTVVGRDGKETLAIANTDFSKSYYLVVKHRNHLAIGSRRALKLAMKREEAVLMDMRLLDNIYISYGDLQQHVCWLGQADRLSLFGMYVGDVFENALISINNVNEGIWQTEDKRGYYKADVDFDGVVTVPRNLDEIDAPGFETNDLSKIYNNRDKFSEIKN